MNNLFVYISTKKNHTKRNLKDNNLVNVPMLLVLVVVVVVVAGAVVALRRISKLLDQYDVNIADNQWVIRCRR